VKVFLDKTLKGYAMLFDGPLEVVDAAERGAKFCGIYNNMLGGWADGALGGQKLRLRAWPEVRAALLNPNPEGARIVNNMLEKLRRELPPPQSRQRKRQWSEITGEVDFDRAMRGDHEYMSDVHRRYSCAPQHVALLCNLDAYAGDTPEKVFWRGAAAIASCDLLEDAGYSCEVWVWCYGNQVFDHPYHRQFSSYRIKGAGEPIDTGSMINSLSSWFLRTALFGSFWGCGPRARSCGGAIYRLDKGWRDHMEVTEGVTELMMPPAFTEEMAMTAARGMLDKVNQKVEA